jgi:hypothetical protein
MAEHLATIGVFALPGLQPGRGENNLENPAPREKVGSDSALRRAMMFATVIRSKRVFSVIAIWVVSVLGLQLADAAQNVGLTWNPSTDPSVSGYRIYYGPASGYYTNTITAGNVTSLTISGLVDGATYFFAAKSYSASGVESGFSNETIFSGAPAQPGTILQLEANSLATGGRYQFSLASGAPAGASVNPTNGTFTWTPDLSFAATTNYVSVVLKDLLNGGATTVETLAIQVGDYFQIHTGPIVASVGSDGRVPIILTCSAGITNVVFDVAWPGNLLLDPTLTTTLPQTAGSLENFGTHILLHIWTVSGQIPAGSNQVGQISFHVAAQPTTTELTLASQGAAATKANASQFNTPLSACGDVVVVGTKPLLKPSASVITGNTLTVYGNPPANYEVQASEDLRTWQTVLSYGQTNLMQEVALPASGPTVFYRVIQP